MSAPPAGAAAEAELRPVRQVTVLYDATCSLCRAARAWIERQPRAVAVEFLPAGGAEAQQRFPFLDPAMTLEDLTVVGDGGEVWVGAKAWVVCLWALEGRQALARRLSSPAVMPKARAVVAFVSRHRKTLGAYGEGCGCTPA
jgi:predicted DCC family thiol-disulfide oxidoreductase YuxK